LQGTEISVHHFLIIFRNVFKIFLGGDLIKRAQSRDDRPLMPVVQGEKNAGPKQHQICGLAPHEII
jgi:hypothetical protein